MGENDLKGLRNERLPSFFIMKLRHRNEIRHLKAINLTKVLKAYWLFEDLLHTGSSRLAS